MTPGVVSGVIAAADRFQRRSRIAGPAYAVLKKFGDDKANLYVVALGWYGFTAIYPLLLVVVTVFGYIGAASLGTGVVTTLHDFPVIGAQFHPGPGGSNLHGSPAGLAIGLVGLVYGAQGVTQSAEQAMASVWNLPRTERPGFLSRLLRSVSGLVIIGGSFLLNAFVASLASAHGKPLGTRIAMIAGLLLVNIALYLASFRVLTPIGGSLRQFVPGAILGGFGFTVLITVGSGLVEHQLRHSSATYGAFAAVIGVVAFLLLLSKLSLYAAELNPVLARRLWPRALPTTAPTDADDRVLRALARETDRRADEAIEVEFGQAKGEGGTGRGRNREDSSRRPPNEVVARAETGHLDTTGRGVEPRAR